MHLPPERLRDISQEVFALPASAENATLEIWHATLAKYARSFSKGEVLALEGDDYSAVVCVLDGWLSLSKSLESGHVQIIDFALAGDMVEAFAADGETAAVGVEALQIWRLGFAFGYPDKICN